MVTFRVNTPTQWMSTFLAVLTNLKILNTLFLVPPEAQIDLGKESFSSSKSPSSQVLTRPIENICLDANFPPCAALQDGDSLFGQSGLSSTLPRVNTANPDSSIDGRFPL